VSSHAAYSEKLSELCRSVSALLPVFLAAQRWFGGKARQVRGMEITDAVPVSHEGANAVVLLVRVTYVKGAEETYSIPIIVGAQSGDDSLQDAFSRPQFLAELLNVIRREDDVAGEKGRLRGCQAPSFSELLAVSEAAQPKRLTGEQSNSSVIYGDRAMLKFFRRIEEGENPDLEIGRFLTHKARFPHVPRIAGWIEYRPLQGKPATQAILQEFAPNQGDAWRYALKTLSAFYEQAENSSSGRLPERDRPRSGEGKQFSSEPMAHLLADIALLGERTAELHLALCSESDDPAFAPEPFTMQFQSKLEGSFAELTSRTLSLLRAQMADVPPEYREQSRKILEREQEIVQRFRKLLRAPINAMRIRIHGDYHLGQVLYTGADFVIIDFEGEPARPLAERRIKQSPLQDVAGMLRSFHYAAFAPLLMPPTGSSVSQRKNGSLSRLAEAWSRCAADRFLGRYYATSGASHYLPAGTGERANVLEMYLLAKAIYELGYELNNRPAWVGIPLEGISRLLFSED
jgi:trehalose synthase-fused probable maltokinase